MDGSGLSQTIKDLEALLAKVDDPMQDDWDPLRFAYLFAKLEYSDLDVEAGLRSFREMLAPYKVLFEQPAPFREKTRLAIDIFVHKLGFTGDKTNYYNLKNSFLPDIMLRRKGIPISLSLIFMGICREFGLRAVGIGFPGHFLVRLVPSKAYIENNLNEAGVAEWRSQTYVDAFDNGKELSTEDCQKRLAEWTRGLVPFGPDALKPAHPRDILARQLRNLRAIFMEKEDLPRLYWVLSALIELCPAERIESFRERGLLLGRMERYPAACVDFKKYLELCEDAARRQHVQGLLHLFQARTEVCN